MIAHPPLSTKSNNKLNNIRRKNYSKKKSSTDGSKKKLSEIEKLEMENQEMEQRLLELKQNLAREKEKRLKQGKTSFWQNGKKGVLFNHGNEIIYNKNISQMKDKNSVFGKSLSTSSYSKFKNNELNNTMRYNLKNKNDFNILTTPSTIHRTDPNLRIINSLTENKKINKTESGTSVTYKENNNSNNKNNNSNNIKEISETNTENNDNKRQYMTESQTESINEKNNDIIYKNTNHGLINFNKYINNVTDNINSISISTNEEKPIIKSKYDEITSKKSSGINTSYNDDDDQYYNNNIYYSRSMDEEKNRERLIDGEFNEEESHNSFLEALNMWRKERNEEKKSKLKSYNENKKKVTFNDNYNSMNVSETQTKELDHSLNIDEIVKNIQNSQSNLSYMDRLALHKYRQQYKENLEYENKPKSNINTKDIDVLSIDEDEIEEEVEKYLEEHNNSSEDDEKEIEDNINNYVNQYKMNQLAIRENNNGNLYKKASNTKTSVIIEDSFSEGDDNEIIEYNDVLPIVAEPDEN